MKKIILHPTLAFFACILAMNFTGLGTAQTTPSPKASPPILVTSCGQSEGPSSLNTILKRVGVAYDIAPLATVKDLKAKSYKTLIITMGASLKGMGAAGIAIDDELNRITELIDAAKKDKITIVGAHIEGMKRRAQGAEAGDTTDEQSIDTVAPKSDILFIKKEGNEDGRFTIIAQAKKIPMIEFEKNMDMVAALTKLFK
ncbi:MAG: DUF6305 family protein [Candidatus Aminicenantes bacterium]|nr:DUF6305 family protein [Candidatus Aminicenantes bacterium]